MRSSTLTLACGLALALLPFLVGPCLAEDWSVEHLLAPSSIWDGFEKGTMVEYRSVTTIEIDGRSARGGEDVKETRLTLLDVTETEYVVRVEHREDGTWRAETIREPRSPRPPSTAPTVEADGEETLTIDGQPYRCVRRKVTNVNDLLDGPRLTGEDERTEAPRPGVVWEHATRGLLKVEAQEPAEGGTATTTLVAKRLDVPHAVAEETLSCRELSWSTNMVGGETLRLESMDVPGRKVLVTGHVEQGPVRITHREELVALTRRVAAGGEAR